MLDQQALTTILTGAGVLLALAGYLHAINKGLEQRIEATRTEARTENTQLRNDMNSGFAAVGQRLGVLEQRSYDLSTRLPPAPASTEVE